MASLRVSWALELQHAGTSRLSSIKCRIAFQTLHWGQEQIDKNYVTVVCLIVVLGADGQEESGNTVGAIPGQAGRDYPNFQVKILISR